MVEQFYRTISKMVAILGGELRLKSNWALEVF
jgi:hypothetical protein